MSTINTYWFSFPQPDKVINLNDRLSWRTKAKRTAEWRRAAYFGACGWRSHPALRRLTGRCVITIVYPTKQPNKRRDPHNWMPTTKAIIDGLTDAQLWPDDSSQYVSVADAQFADMQLVYVTITNYPPEDSCSTTTGVPPSSPS